LDSFTSCYFFVFCVRVLVDGGLGLMIDQHFSLIIVQGRKGKAMGKGRLRLQAQHVLPLSWRGGACALAWLRKPGQQNA